MAVSVAPALLIGLTARLLMEYLSHSHEYGLRDFFMTGLWQGVLWYTLKSYDLSIPAAVIIAAKLFIEYSFSPDILKATGTIVGIALGAIGTDFLSNIFDQPTTDRRKRSHSTSNGHVHQSRSRSSRRAERSAHNSSRRRSRKTTSDITSVDTNSDLIGPGTMSPIEREVAALRARASLADSERRRFKEEKKWARAQGNKELASQMSWQVKRYSALMKSFHREADTKLLEAASRPRLQTIEEHPPIASSSNEHRSKSTRAEGTVKPDHPTISVDIEPSQIKSAIRLNVR
ncbi:hypothetical protein D9758_001912 [Tetrapyrgos nigripes]|uniref:Uncharacterized protein n=1 Tax=Tetrapyrgos nigripes TaxID=182062 RepID=A0A8H5GTB9_9AGAR|nr:hypothetical protein D9758_001912 [Tetrapyrgos nigripes]